MEHTTPEDFSPAAESGSEAALVRLREENRRLTLECQALSRSALEAEARFRGAFDDSSSGMALVSLEGRWLKVNSTLCQMLGFAEHEMLAMSLIDVTHPEDLQIDQTFMQLVLLGQLSTYQMETRYYHKDGHPVPVLLSSSLVRDAEGRPQAFIAKIEDITQRRKMEDALYAEKDLAQTTLQSIGDAVVTTDAEGRVTYINPVAERLTGWPSRAALGQPFDAVVMLVQEDSRTPVASPVTQVLADGKAAKLAQDALLIARDGGEYFIDNSAAPIHLRDGSLSGAVMVFHDVTDQRMLNRKISFQASHDALTGLFNRSEFELTATQLLQSARILQRVHALLYLDLDKFKIVNDTCGHLAGDHLLRQLSATLLSQTRKSDLLARLGGDEFGILLEGCPPERALEIAKNLVDIVHAFRFEWEGKVFAIGVSIGMVVIDEHSGDLSSLLRAADAACYDAKENGRNRVEVFHGRVAGAEAAVRIDWGSRLREAEAQERFTLFFQRVAALDGSDSVPQVEILLRYRDEEGRMMLPMAFIPTAERHGLLPAIDRWVIRRLCALDAAALAPFGEATLLTVNVSGAALVEEGFLESVVEALRVSTLSPTRLCFEIAESAAISNLHRAQQFIEAVRARGAYVALDDFGGGLSSFGYLKRLPVDFIKIDGAIVKGADRDLVDAEMVESIQRIATVMGITAIAKCVETEALRAGLARMGVVYGQGYALHMPEALPASPALAG